MLLAAAVNLPLIALALLQAPTKYVALLDDDQIPGPSMLELLLGTAEQLQHPAILGLTGRAFTRPTLQHGVQWYHGRHHGYQLN